MIISMPESCVKIATPQPSTSAGRTQVARRPDQPRVFEVSSIRVVSAISSISPSMS